MNFFPLPVTFQSQVLVSSSPGEEGSYPASLCIAKKHGTHKPAGRCSREEDLKKAILIQSSLTGSILSLQFFYNKGIERKIY
jgi:hypothetical protein